MKYTSLFKGKAKEIDVVGTFKTATPKIVLKARKTVIIPYDAIAILSEVKSVLNNKKLNEDLEKFKKLAQLNPSKNRFLPNPPLDSTEMREDKPFRLLVYFKTPIDFAEIEHLLTSYIDFWDAVLLVDKEEILLNRNLPIIKRLDASEGLKDKARDMKYQHWEYASFMLLLLAITRTVPIPAAVDVITTLFGIAISALPNKKKNKKNQKKGHRKRPTG
jgi:hypothetical protein